MEVEVYKSGLDNNCKIIIEEARNGYIVRGMSSRTSGELEYVYESWKELMGELSSIKSVLKQDPMKNTEEDLEKEEKKLEKKKGDY